MGAQNGPIASELDRYDQEWTRYDCLDKCNYKNIVLDIMINHCEYNIEKYTNCSDKRNREFLQCGLEKDSWYKMSKKSRLKNLYDNLCMCLDMYGDGSRYLNSGSFSDFEEEDEEEEEEGSYSIWKAYDKGNHNTDQNYERGFTSYQEALDRAEELKDDCLSSGQMMQHLSIIQDADDDHIWSWSREDEEEDESWRQEEDESDEEEDESDEEEDESVEEEEEDESEYESDSDVNRQLALLGESESDEDVVVIDASHLWNTAKIVYQADPK